MGEDGDSDDSAVVVPQRVMGCLVEGALGRAELLNEGMRLPEQRTIEIDSCVIPFFFRTDALQHIHADHDVLFVSMVHRDTVRLVEIKIPVLLVNGKNGQIRGTFKTRLKELRCGAWLLLTGCGIFFARLFHF
jgi:hypothetical protein